MIENIVTYEGVKLHKGQARILKEIMANIEAKYIIIKTSRQWGKTLFAEQLALYHSINSPNSIVAWFSPYIAQAKKVMNELYSAIAKSGVVYSYNQTDRIITLCNNSKIQFFGSNNPDGIRGISVDYAIIDEAAFIQRDVIEEIIRPALMVRGKKVYIVSTPKGKHNWFYYYYVNSDEEFLACESNWRENPYTNINEINLAKKTLPEHIYRQEYEGEFLDGDYQVFRNLDEIAIQTTFAKQTAKNYAGLDLGRKNDYTVLTIMNENGEIVEIYRDNNKLWQTILHNVISILRKYNCPVYVDATGVGDAVYEQLHAQYKQTYPIVLGNNNKQNIIEELIIGMEKKEITIPTKDLYSTLYDELSIFEFNYSPKTQKVTYNAPSGMHDDCVISLALAHKCKKDNKSTSFKILKI